MTEPSIPLAVLGSCEVAEFEPEQLVIAGYTGSDPDQVQKHIDELAAQGVEPPEQTPTFFDVPASLLTTAPAIQVGGDRTSGEVEPVLFCCEDAWYVGVGSDHTDRELERDDIAASKAACPKPIGVEVIPYERALEAWPRMTLKALADASQMQDGATAGITPIPEIVAEFKRRGGRVERGLALFLGTVPLETASFVFGNRYEMTLGLGDRDASIGLSYEVASGAAGSSDTATVSAEGVSGSEA